MFPHFSTLEQFLQWLVGPGSMIVAGFLAAYVLERLSLWHKLHHDVKAIGVLLLAFGISYGATFVMSQPSIMVNPFLNEFFLFVVMYGSSQLAYKRYFEINVAQVAPQPVKK